MEIFIGRRQQISSAITALREADEGVVMDVVGVHGIGKTEFLKQVRANAVELVDRPAIMGRDFGQRGFDEGVRGDAGPTGSTEALSEFLARSRSVLLEWADYFTEELRCSEFEEFKLTCADAEGPSRPDPGDRAQLLEWQARLEVEFVEAWEEFTTRRPALILLDHFDRAVQSELGIWALRLASRLPKTLTVVARTPTRSPDVDPLARRRLELPYFSPTEVAEYLTQRFPGEHLSPDVATIVHEFTGGHPGGTALAGTLLREKGSDLEPRALRRILDRLPDDPQQRWGTMVRLIVDAVADPVLRNAVDAVSITLSFDDQLLAALLEGNAPTSQGNVNSLAIRALKEQGLIQDVDRDGLGREEAQSTGTYRMVEFVRRSLADDVRTSDSKRWERLHKRAADHYFEQLEKDESEFGAGTYGQWYRYEKSVWQADKRGWLYHSGMLQPVRRPLTRARFVIVFLEAFWWWGCYQKFDFNQWLLDDWERACAVPQGARQDKQMATDDADLAAALQFVLDNYPLGHVKPAEADWDGMSAKLLQVQYLCGLESGYKLPGDGVERKQMARARALIRIFLAHTRRFRDPADPEADLYYEQALKVFRALRDDWVISWLLFEQADLALERRRQDDAVALIGEAATRSLGCTLGSSEDGEDGDDVDDGLDDDLARDKDPGWDYELLANLHRARADAYWLSADVEEAGREYGRAVTNAYWFQGRPHPPDAYTQRFYEEITGRAADRVLELRSGGMDRAVRFASLLGAELPPSAQPTDVETAVGGDDQATVQRALFPPGPQSSDFRSSGSPFMQRWLMLWGQRCDTAVTLSALAAATGAS